MSNFRGWDNRFASAVREITEVIPANEHYSKARANTRTTPAGFTRPTRKYLVFAAEGA
jgi:hypothetical protein